MNKNLSSNYMKIVIVIVALVLVLGGIFFINKYVSNKGKTMSYLNMMKSGNYHMKYTWYDGNGVEVINDLYFKGDKLIVIVYAHGEVSKNLFRDGKQYFINEDTKEYILLGEWKDAYTALKASTTPIDMDTKGMKYVTSGTTMFNGKNLYYDEYAGDYRTLQFFTQNDNFVGLRGISGFIEEDLIIHSLDQNIPSNIFDVPTNYKELQ